MFSVNGLVSVHGPMREIIGPSNLRDHMCIGTVFGLCSAVSQVATQTPRESRSLAQMATPSAMRGSRPRKTEIEAG